MWGCGFGRRSPVGIHFCDSIQWVDLVNKFGGWGYLRWVGGTVGGDRTVVVEVGEGLAVVMKDCVTVGGWGYLRWVFVGRRRKFLAVVEAGEGTGGSEENERL
jgi:hypothetical protein